MDDGGIPGGVIEGYQKGWRGTRIGDGGVPGVAMEG